MKNPQPIGQAIRQLPLQKDICHSDGDIYADIELTEAEINEAIQAFRLNRSKQTGMPPERVVINSDRMEQIIRTLKIEKESAGRMKEYWKRVYSTKEIVYHSPKQMFEIFKQRASSIMKKEFVIDQDNELIIKKLCLYFTNSPECEKYGIDLNKGIMLAGGLGTGKTTIMKAFSLNQRQSFIMKTCRHIGYEFAEHGFKIIKQFDYVETCPANQYGQTELGICFDDLGTDEERRHWGNNVNALSEILQNRYDSVPSYHTHITTNLNANQIEAIYGQRVRSRTRDVFNLITFPLTAIDRRK